MITRILALGIALALCGCAPAASTAAKPASPTRVRLTSRALLPMLDADLPHVLARVPGLGELTLLVDTGAEVSWIAPDFVDEHDLPHEPFDATLIDIMGVESAIAGRSYVATLELDSLVVTDWRPLIVRPIDPAIDGSLGQDILRMATLVIDGPHRRIILSPEADLELALGEFFERGATAFSYATDPDHDIPKVSVPIAEVENDYTWTIDTGSGQMTVSREFALDAQLEKLGDVAAVGLSFAGGATTEYAVRNLALQDLTVSDDALEAPHCSLGWGVLRNTILVFPKGTRQMLLMLNAKTR